MKDSRISNLILCIYFCILVIYKTKKMIKKLSIKDITDLVSQNTNVPKKVIYNYCLKLKNEK